MRRWLLTSIALWSCACAAGVSVVCPPDATPRMKLAAAEIRRYVYLRTGEMLEIRMDGADGSDRSDRSDGSVWSERHPIPLLTPRCFLPTGLKGRGIIAQGK